MDSEINQWDLADRDLGIWLKGNNPEGSQELADVLKSTYLVFRKKQRSWLDKFCILSLDYLREKEETKEEDTFKYSGKVKFSKSPYRKTEADSLSETEPMYRKMVRIVEPKPGLMEKLTREENDRIILGILSGDQQVFNKLYENEFPKIVRLVTQNSGNLDRAKDIFQDALVIFIEKVYQAELDLTCSVSTYLYSICRNLWLEQLRKDKKNSSLNDLYSFLKADITLSDDTVPDDFENVTDAIQLLGEPCKQLLESFYYQKLSWEVIASSLGYSSAASARNQKYKCLERIRKAVSLN
jgi:RNA polymerase sigma factor (sigma-70 family)